MTSQEKLDTIDALFKQAEAELENQKTIINLDSYTNNLNQTELRSTTIKTVHAIHSIEKSLSVNDPETKSHEEIRESQSFTQELSAQSEKNVLLRRRISDLYELAIKDDQSVVYDQSAVSADDSRFLKEKQTEISATMAEIAHTVKAIPTVQDHKLSTATEIIDPDLKSQIFGIVETITRDIIKNEIQDILGDLLTKQIENKSRPQKKKTKKAQAKKTIGRKSQTKKTQAKKNTGKKSQTKKTQAKKNTGKKSQTKK